MGSHLFCGRRVKELHGQQHRFLERGGVLRRNLFASTPIALVAVWFPRTAGKALLGCAAVSIAAVVSVAVSRHTSPLAEIGRFIAFTALYNIPLLFFGLAYIMAAGRTGTTGTAFHEEAG
jgi:hypothetical protein